MRRVVKHPIPVLLLAAIFGVGCSSDPIETAPEVEQAAAGMSEEVRQLAEGAARDLAADVRAGRAVAVADRLDLDVFVDGVFTGLAVRRQVRQDFQKGFEQGLADRAGGMLSDYLEQDFRFLRLVEIDGHTQMLFRAWDEEDGVNYLRAAFRGEFGAAGDAEWRVVDLFSFTSGEWFSGSTRRTFLPLLVAESGGELKREDERRLMAEYEAFQQVVEAADRGEYQGALRKLERVSGKLRGQRFARLLKLQILSRIEEEPEAYTAALAKFRDDFPNDPSSPLLLLEYHSLSGESEKALGCIDELETQLGGDPFLHFMRAGALSALGRESEAIAGLQEAVVAEPEIEELRWALIQAALAAGENGIVAETLRELRRDFEYQMSAEEIEGADEYRDFARSEEGKTLLGELRAPPEE